MVCRAAVMLGMDRSVCSIWSRAKVKTVGTPKQDVVLVWVPKGTKAAGEDFANGEAWSDLEAAIIHAHEAKRQDRRVPWIRCEQKFVLSPDDIVAAYGSLKNG